MLDRWAFETGTLRGVAPQFVPSNDSAAGGQRAFKMPVGLKIWKTPSDIHHHIVIKEECYVPTQ
jgi:hypothetical protein